MESFLFKFSTGECRKDWATKESEIPEDLVEVEERTLPKVRMMPHVRAAAAVAGGCQKSAHERCHRFQECFG